MATYTIVINSKDQDARDFPGVSKQEALAKTSKLFQGLASGSIDGTVDLFKSSTAPVAASATATLTYGSLANATDTLVLFGVTITCVTGTPAASDATTGQFKKQTDATVSAVNLAATINAHPTLIKYCTATSALAVVTITLNLKGSIGNFVTTNTSAGSGIANVAYSGGTGGPETAKTSY